MRPFALKRQVCIKFTKKVAEFPVAFEKDIRDACHHARKNLHGRYDIILSEPRFGTHEPFFVVDMYYLEPAIASQLNPARQLRGISGYLLNTCDHASQYKSMQSGNRLLTYMVVDECELRLPLEYSEQKGAKE